MFYNNARKTAVNRLKNAEKVYNNLAKEANDTALELYQIRKSASCAIDRIEKYINSLANTPKEFTKEIAEIKIGIKEFNEAARIEKQNNSDNIKGATMATGGTIAGGLIASLGPTAAMAIATTFGKASTGVLIANLSGAAATKAALAWLGGGALAAGGGGMAAGNAFLALAGPVGWSIASVLAIGGGVFAFCKNKKAAEEAQKAAKKIEDYISKLRPKFNKLKNIKDKTKKLKSVLDISLMVNTYPKDYLMFSQEQKETLAALINNARSMGKLINERIS